MKMGLERLQERGRGKDELSLLARAIKTIGTRNYTAIAKVTGLPVESVRYKVRHQLYGRGIRVQVHVDHGKLGLARYWLGLRFSNNYENVNVMVLDELSRSGYLEYYGRLLPRGDYIAYLGLPPYFEPGYRTLLDKLVDKGILGGYSMSRMSWIRYLSMREDCYDFRKGFWSFTWDSLSSPRLDDVSVEEDVVSSPRLDKLDLYVTAWLQVDALTPISKVARKLGIHYKKVLYHFKEHVLKKGVLKKYVLRWQGGMEGSYSLAYLLVRVGDLGGEELEDAKRAFHRIPFTCFDTYETGKRRYTAYITAPVNHLQQCLNYIREALPSLRDRILYELIDPTCSKAFSIPFELYRDDRGWVFSVEETLGSLQALAIPAGGRNRGTSG